LHPGYFIYAVLLGTMSCFTIAVYQKFCLSLPRAHGVSSIVSFGGMSMTLGLISLISALITTNRKLRLLCITGFFLAAYASILSLSRGPWLTVITSLIVILILNPKKWSRKSLILGSLVCISLMVLVYTLPSVKNRINAAVCDVNDYFSRGEVTEPIGVRLEAWRVSIKEAIDNPILGIGEGNFKNFIKFLVDNKKADPNIHILSHVHNEILSAALHRGLPGLITLLLLFFVPFGIFLYRLKSAQKEDILFLCNGIILITCTITVALSDIYFGQHQPTLFFIFFLYMIMAFTRRLEPVHTKQETG